MTPRVIPAIRRCIYCSRDGVSLGREHVVPEGLGGTLIILKACCRDCEDAIRRYEQPCIRNTFESPRTYLQIKSKAKHKARKRRLLIGRGREPDAVWSEADFDDFPFTFGIPIVGPPSLISGTVDTNDCYQATKIGWWMAPTAYLRLAELGDNGRVRTQFQIDQLFALYVKIGHGFAVAELGLGGFEHIGTNVIRGIPDQFSNSLVGISEVQPLATGALHELSLQILDGFVTVLIQLFAPLGFPTFQVVVGHKL